MRRARDLGYRRIGLAMNYKADERVNHLWIAGFLTSVHEHPELIAVPPLVAHTWGPEPFHTWIEQHQPDCVISHGVDVCQWLADAGLKMPDNIGYATVSWNSQKAAYAGTYQNYELIGAEAVNIVVGRLNRNERGLPENPHIVLVKGRWIAGPSLGRPPAPNPPEAKPAGPAQKKPLQKRTCSTSKIR
jgi:LacI family transcriptional regulator